MSERVRVAGIDIHWNLENGHWLWMDNRALALWLETSVAGLMSGIHRMVGTQRFNLSMIAGGRDSTEGDWQVISSFSTFEAGFNAVALNAAVAGWGKWELLAIDLEKKEARFRIRDSWEACYQRALGVDWGSSYSAGKLAGICAKVFGTNCWPEQTRFAVNGEEFDEFIVRASNTSVERELEELLSSDKATRADLAVALEKLKHEVEERQETERKLREQLHLTQQQEEAIRALSAPVIQVWPGVLALPLVGTLSSRRAADMTDRLLGEIVRTRSRFAILDLTGVEMVDELTADHLIKIVRAVELLGARSIITGIRPVVAQTMISLGLDLSQIVTLSNLQEGLMAAMRQMASEERGG
jgi:rsbT co-antagonist protein RsbR